MSDDLQAAVAKAKAAAQGNSTLAQTTSDPDGAKAPNKAQDQANAGVGVASAAPKLGPEINPASDNPSPKPNPGAGAPAATPTTTLAHPAAVLEPKKGGKVYHNTHPGSTFITKKGEIISFDAKGELSVTDPDTQKELDDIADKPGCPVYTKSYVPGQNEGRPVDEIQSRAAQTKADLVAQQQRTIR